MLELPQAELKSEPNSPAINGLKIEESKQFVSEDHISDEGLSAGGHSTGKTIIEPSIGDFGCLEDPNEHEEEIPADLKE